MKEIQQYPWLPSQFCINFSFSFSWIGLYCNTLILNEQSSLGPFLLHFVGEKKKSHFKQDYTSDRITPDINAIFYLSELWFTKLRAFRVYYMTLFCVHDTSQSLKGFFPPLCVTYKHVWSFPSSVGGLKLNNAAVKTKRLQQKLLCSWVLQTVYNPVLMTCCLQPMKTMRYLNNILIVFLLSQNQPTCFSSNENTVWNYTGNVVRKLKKKIVIQTDIDLIRYQRGYF